MVDLSYESDLRIDLARYPNGWPVAAVEALEALTSWTRHDVVTAQVVNDALKKLRSSLCAVTGETTKPSLEEIARLWIMRGKA